ncbi:MAG: hypothetical protein V8Q27_03655 [Eubacteriales bacterium]
MYERMLTLAQREEADVTVCGPTFDFDDPKIPGRDEISNFKKEVYDRKALEIFSRRLSMTAISSDGRCSRPG